MEQYIENYFYEYGYFHEGQGKLPYSEIVLIPDES